MSQCRINQFIAVLLCLALAGMALMPRAMAIEIGAGQHISAASPQEACPHHQAGREQADEPANQDSPPHQGSCQHCQLCSGMAALPSVLMFHPPRALVLDQSSPAQIYQSPDLAHPARPPNPLLLARA
jgi:hypothetical protein